MEYNNDFKYDLKLGNKGENLLAEIRKISKHDGKNDIVAQIDEISAMRTNIENKFFKSK